VVGDLAEVSVISRKGELRTYVGNHNLSGLEKAGLTHWCGTVLRGKNPFNCTIDSKEKGKKRGGQFSRQTNTLRNKNSSYSTRNEGSRQPLEEGWTSGQVFLQYKIGLGLSPSRKQRGETGQEIGEGNAGTLNQRRYQPQRELRATSNIHSGVTTTNGSSRYTTKGRRSLLQGGLDGGCFVVIQKGGEFDLRTGKRRKN